MTLQSYFFFLLKRNANSYSHTNLFMFIEDFFKITKNWSNPNVHYQQMDKHCGTSMEDNTAQQQTRTN